METLELVILKITIFIIFNTLGVIIILDEISKIRLAIERKSKDE